MDNNDNNNNIVLFLFCLLTQMIYTIVCPLHIIFVRNIFPLPLETHKIDIKLND